MVSILLEPQLRDGLKYINDNFGHEAGDYAIRAAANAIDSVSIENKV